MNAQFLITSIGSTRVLAFRPWWERSIIHGMTLSDIDFTDAEIETSVGSFLSELEVGAIIIPRQTHGAEVVVVDSEREWSQRVQERRLLRTDAADAVVALPSSSLRCGIGIRTADCVPIIVEGVTSHGVATWSVIHAGWRGLACSVIEAACKKMRELGALTEAAVFACGGSGVYEVGEEVLDAIGESAVYEQNADGRALLDLGETAARQLEKFLPREKISVAGMCTITSKERDINGRESQLFHSFRRDGVRSGRSVTFVIPNN
jgi:copper oxidase (laccase) domain-containing protein